VDPIESLSLSAGKVVPRTSDMRNQGGATDYYELPRNAEQLQDLIEFRGMNFAVGNIFKACYRLGSKPNTDTIYDLNKIIFFAQREKARIEALL